MEPGANKEALLNFKAAILCCLLLFFSQYSFVLMVFAGMPSYINTFAAIVDLSRFNNSCLKSPASTSVDLIFQSSPFRLNQLTWRDTCTAASVDIIFIPFIVYYAYIAI